MFKRKSTEKPKLPKEYVWELDYDGVIKVYKCVVTETMVTTYEGDKECKHLKIMNPECKQGVLQIDTITSIYGEQVQFQLERYIPYIRLQDGWESSDTTKQDRLDATVATYKKNSVAEITLGILGVLATVIKFFVTGEIGDWLMLAVFGVLFITAGVSTRIRLKRELDAMKETQTEEAPAEEKLAQEEPAEPSQRLEGLKSTKTKE